MTEIENNPEPSTQQFNYTVKVPKNHEENMALKAGFEEDDNEDLAYFNFRLI